MQRSILSILSASLITVVYSPLYAQNNNPINVVVWDEQQPRQAEAYDNFLGNEIAKYLQAQSGLNVRSMKLDDAEQGLADAVLDACHVLVWWGHVRQREITPEKGQEIVQRIKSGNLSLIALHSAHWATPFVQAMYDRTRTNVAQMFPTDQGENVKVEYIDPPKRYFAPTLDTPVTPFIYPRKYPGSLTKVQVDLPNCCFPGYRPDGKPSFLNTLKSDHPIAKGIPREFQVSGTEMYNEPFHVPAPDEVIFEERWPTGEWFRSGAVWNIGKGRVFYFRPGHETYPVYKEEIPLKIVENAVRWLGGEVEASR